MVKTGSKSFQVFERWLTVKDCAALLNCSVPTIWRWVSAGAFPKPIKLGHLTRWSENEVSEFLSLAKEARDAA